jgi:hypothetical protein
MCSEDPSSDVGREELHYPSSSNGGRGGKEQPGFQASELASARAQRGSPEAFLLARVWEVRVKAVEALPLRWASGPGYGSVANTHRQRNPWAGV